MQIVIRADASRKIGTGHVMRCLCLADVLRSLGCIVTFVCRTQKGHMIDRIKECGIACLPLANFATQSNPGGKTYTDWLGTSEMQDASDFLEALNRLKPDLVIVDHYALGTVWESAVRKNGARIVAIDDLANRVHDCDILLDQTLDRVSDDYLGLVPKNCDMLLGTKFALLRPEFQALHQAIGKEYRAWPPKRVLISLGGVDNENATAAVLQSLAETNLPHETELIVVMGRKAPWLESVKNTAQSIPFRVDVRVDVKNMAELMTSCDFAIGASGTSGWERCAAGLPSLLLVLADNQQFNAQALHASGAARMIGVAEETGWQIELANALSKLALPGAMQKMSQSAAALVDGRGATRVGGNLIAKSLVASLCEPTDAHDVWTWREADGASQFYRSNKATQWADHKTWFNQAIKDPMRLMLMIGLPGHNLAHVRLDRSADDPASATVGICLNPDMRGMDLSAPSLKVAIDHASAQNIHRIFAEVHRDNTASIRLFSRLGFAETAKDGDFVQFTLNSTRLGSADAWTDIQTECRN